MRRGTRWEVEATADFYMLKPVDPGKSMDGCFTKSATAAARAMLPTFQKAAGSPDPTTDAEFGDGALMRQGFVLVWMGWQWDVPDSVRA